jgi:hypothetical protein
MNQLLSMQGRARLEASVSTRLNMKRIRSLAALTAVALAGLNCATRTLAEEGVALAIIYDTSGSMHDPVPNQSGGTSPKYLIANRALIDVARQIQSFATNTSAGTSRKIETGLFIFHNAGAREAIPFGPFDAAALQNWARHFSHPNGNTPLGNALNTAGRAVLDSPLSHKHVLIITDGMNTAGPPPSAILPRLKELAQRQGSSLSVHFVAFDVDAKQFDSVKKQGATVVGAADEKQLNSQLDFILQRKILLEDEESPKPKTN